MSYRYYTTHRPPGIGAVPTPEGNHITEIVEYPARAWCDAINRPAWGYVEYEKPLSDEDIRSYELDR